MPTVVADIQTTCRQDTRQTPPIYIGVSCRVVGRVRVVWECLPEDAPLEAVSWNQHGTSGSRR